MSRITKQITSIGSTTINVVKYGDGIADGVEYNLYDGSGIGSSPNTVMHLSGDSGESSTTQVSNGYVSVHNLHVNGTLTSASTSAPTITIGEKLYFTDFDPDAQDTTRTIGSIYTSTGTGDNHTLYIDPYREDTTSSTTTNKGTVHILGSLIVEGDKTFLDTTTKVTSDNAIAVNGTLDDSGNLVGTTAISGGLTFAHSNDNTYGNTEYKDLFYNTSDRHWTIGSENFNTTGTVTVGSLTDGTATLSGGTLTLSSGSLTVASGSKVAINDQTDSVATSIGSGALVVEGGVSIKKHLYLGRGTTGVLGDIVLVSTTSGGLRSANPILSAGTTVVAPLGIDISNYFRERALYFGTGQFVVSLVENAITASGTAREGEIAAAIGNFLYTGTTLQLVHTLESESTNLSTDVENSSGTVNLKNTSNNEAFYHVRILTVADTSSARGGY